MDKYGIALGQSNGKKRPIAGILHIIVYVGFVVINIELLEIIIDGLLVRIVFCFFRTTYNILIASFEILAFLVLVAVLLLESKKCNQTEAIVSSDLKDG
jgi:hypothetical protein